MIKMAVFASGSGSNAENLVNYFNHTDFAEVSLILTNNKDAGVIERAHKLKVKCLVLSDNDFKNGEGVLNLLEKEKIKVVVLAGFLLLVPGNLISAFKNRIVNIHPALLPLHGGKGFYGKNVHESVIRSGVMMSGITIHRVNEKYDEGEIIFQAGCHVSKEETPDSLAEKIHHLEYTYFPVVIEKLIQLLPR